MLGNRQFWRRVLLGVTVATIAIPPPTDFAMALTEVLTTELARTGKFIVLERKSIADIVLGLIGSYIGGWIFIKLGIFGGGFLYSLAAATLGAVILVSIAHLFVGGND